MEQLELKTTPIIEMPNVEANMLSEIGDFQEKVDKFQERWNINLEFNENARWRPGSYERLKQQVVDALFPQWQQPKGANNISKLTNFNRWNANELRIGVMEIDRFLKTFRMNKTSLDSNKLEELRERRYHEKRSAKRRKKLDNAIFFEEQARKEFY